MEEVETEVEEPLNLCKRKKPVAVVAPSSVLEEEVVKPADRPQEEVRQAACTGSLYEMIRSLAACEQGFLTAMYMGNLLASSPYYRNYPGLSSDWTSGSRVLTPPGPFSPTLPLKPSPTYPKVDLKIPQPVPSAELRSIGKVSDLAEKKEKKSKSKVWTSSLEHKNSSSSTNESSKTQDSGHASNNQAEKKKPHIKKPLNAFMLYMKEMRAKVVAECTLKESAAINQILGRRWHSLSREEQAKYYEKARIERQLHMELYPGWSARDNYGYGTKKKKRKKERVSITDTGGNSMKKCRARYGLDQQSQWCKPCRRKKKCVRYKECGGEDGTQSEEGVGSCGSGGACEDGDEEDDEEEGSEGYSGSSPGGVPFGGSPGMPFGGSPGGPYGASSPGGLSALSSLTSPSGLLSPPSAPSLSPLTPHHAVAPPPDYPPDIKPLPRPVGANPRDANNPLSVNQLTAKCIKNSSPSPSNSKDPPPPSRTAISVP